MKFVSLGSRIIDDAINGCTGKKNSNELRITGISPFVLSWDNGSIQWLLSEKTIKEENSYKRKVAFWEMQQSVVEHINEKKYDYLIIDLMQSFEEYIEIIMTNGHIFRYSYTAIFKNNENVILDEIKKSQKCEIRLKRIVNPMEWESTRLCEEVERYVQWIKRNFDIKKIIFLISELPFHSITKDGINYYSYYNYLGKVSLFLNECNKIIKEKKEFMFLPEVKIYLGDQMNSRTEILRYHQAYYNLLNSVLDIYSLEERSQRITELVKVYYEEIYKELDEICSKELAKKIIENRNGRKVVLISCNRAMMEDFRKTYQINIQQYIYYNIYTNIDEILVELKGDSQENLLVIPHLYNDNLMEKLWERGYVDTKDIVYIKRDRHQLNDFCGIYTDIYSNRIYSKNSAQFFLDGWGSKVVVENGQRACIDMIILAATQTNIFWGENAYSEKLRITTIMGERINIGEGTTFADNCIIRGTPFMEMSVGADCMFSSKVVIHMGDGHSIFNIDTGEKCNYTFKYDIRKRKINLGEHVWIGYQVLILNGTDIGPGSIIGARTLVNKKYPNNCIIAGNPGYVIKRDIAWARDPFATDLQGEFYVKKDYVQLTEEI